MRLPLFIDWHRLKMSFNLCVFVWKRISSSILFWRRSWMLLSSQVITLALGFVSKLMVSGWRLLIEMVLRCMQFGWENLWWRITWRIWSRLRRLSLMLLSSHFQWSKYYCPCISKLRILLCALFWRRYSLLKQHFRWIHLWGIQWPECGSRLPLLLSLLGRQIYLGRDCDIHWGCW